MNDNVTPIRSDEYIRWYRGQKIVIKYRSETNDFEWEFEQKRVHRMTGNGATINKCEKSAQKYIDASMPATTP